MKRKKSSFYPESDFEEKSNYKRYNFIDRDGSIYERVFLDISDATLRENIISTHYLRTKVMMFLGEDIGVNITSRDAPWDFGIELSNGEFFNIEITQIADSADWFRKFKMEERLIAKSYEDKLPFHEIIKLNHLFPDKELTELIKDLNVKNVSKNDLLDNPLKRTGNRLFLSNGVWTEDSLENLIKEAIEKKELKKHSGKDKTVLIIDNRTIKYEIEDYYRALDTLNEFVTESSFKEVWFYTGYCSNTDGNNADYMLTPMKITKEQEKILSQKTIGRIDKNRVMKLK